MKTKKTISELRHICLLSIKSNLVDGYSLVIICETDKNNMYIYRFYEPKTDILTLTNSQRSGPDFCF